MPLKKRISEQLIERTKAKDVEGKNALRMLLAAIKEKEIELRAPLDDKQVLRVIQGQVRQRREAIRMFEEGGRKDLVDKEEKELAVLTAFMPEPLSEDAMARVVRDVIQELGAKDMKDMGRVMKAAMDRLAGSAEGKAVSEVVRKQLSS